MPGGTESTGKISERAFSFPIDMRTRVPETRPESIFDAARRLDPLRPELRLLEPLEIRLLSRLEEIRLSTGQDFLIEFNKLIKGPELRLRAYDLSLHLRQTIGSLKQEVLNRLPEVLRQSLVNVEIREASILDHLTLTTFRAIPAKDLAEIKGEAVQTNGTLISIPLPGAKGAELQSLVLTFDAPDLSAAQFDAVKLTAWVPELNSALQLNKQIFNDPTFAALNQEAFEIDLSLAHAGKEGGYALAVGVINSVGGSGPKEYFMRLTEAFRPLGAEVYVLENGRVAVLAPKLSGQKVSEVFEKINVDLRAVRACRDLDSGFVLLEVQNPQEVAEKPLEMVDRLSRAAREVEIKSGEVVATETDLTYDREVMENLGLSSRPETGQTPKVGSEVPGFWEEDASPPKGLEITNVDVPDILAYDEDAPTGVFARDIGQQVQREINSAQTSGKPEAVKGQRGHRIELIPITGRSDIPPQLLQARAEMAPVVKALLQKKSSEDVVVLRTEEREGQQRRQQPGGDQQRREEERKFREREKEEWSKIIFSSNLRYKEARTDIARICSLLRIYEKPENLTPEQRLEISQRLYMAEHNLPAGKVKLRVDSRTLKEQMDFVPLPEPVEISSVVSDYFLGIMKDARIQFKTQILSQAA